MVAMREPFLLSAIFLGGLYPLLEMTITVCDRKQYKSVQVAGCYKWIEADGHMSHSHMYMHIGKYKPHIHGRKKFSRRYLYNTHKIHSRTAQVNVLSCFLSVCPLALFRFVHVLREYFLYIYSWAENQSHSHNTSFVKIVYFSRTFLATSYKCACVYIMCI